MIFLPDGFKSVETCLKSCDFYYQVGKDNKTCFQRFYFFDFDTIETKGNLQGEYSTSDPLYSKIENTGKIFYMLQKSDVLMFSAVIISMFDKV